MQIKRTKTNQGSKISLRENLPCRAGEPSKDRDTPGSKPSGRSGRPAGAYGGKTTPPHHLIMMHVVDQCGVKTQSD